MTHPYIFLDNKDFSSMFDYTRSNVVKFKDVENIEDEKSEILESVKTQGISNFYFSFNNDPQVFSASQECDSVVAAGFIVDPSWISPEVKLYHRSMIDKFSDVMLVYDGREISSSLVPENMKMYFNSVEGVESNPVPSSHSMESSEGRVVVSSCNAGGLPQHVFLPFPTNTKKLHMKEQWLSSSKDCDEEQFIGYEFRTRSYQLKSVQMICRLGTHEKPAIASPTPKILVVQGKDPETNQWEDITNSIVLKKTAWKHFTPIEIELHTQEDDVKFYSGFRLKILKWFPGQESDMLTGLMRVKFLCSGSNQMTLPIYPVPSENLLYAQFNPMLVETYPRTTYTKEQKDLSSAKEESTTPVPMFAEKETSLPATISDGNLISTLKIMDGSSMVASSGFADISSGMLIELTPVCRVEWMTLGTGIELDSNAIELKSGVTLFINTSGQNISVKGDLPFYLANHDGSEVNEFEMGSGDRMYVSLINSKWYVYYIEG